MASLPPSRRRQSPTQRSTSPEASKASQALQASHAFTRSENEASEDSQTILKPSSRPSADDATQVHRPAPASSIPQVEQEPRRCWICFTDETEDTPESSPWRSPCPCALEAHESCLLDWVADMESPTSRRRRSPNDKILCPQCKHEIELARPRSYVVEAVRALEAQTSRAVLPGVLALSATSFWYLCWLHGATSVMLVFGPEDGERILAPLVARPPNPERNLQAFLDYLRSRWRLDIGLGLVPPMLIFSRTSLADGVLPIIPMLFFVTKPDTDGLSDFGTWPPSASLSFALLPYVRLVYNECYERVWGKHVRRWLKEIQPRASSEGQEDGNGAGAGGREVEGDNILEVNIDLGVIDEWEEAHPLNEPPQDDAGMEAAPAPDVPRQRRADAGAGADANAGADADANANANANANADANAGADANAAHADGEAPLRAEGQFNLAVSTNRLAESVLGALAFPAISATMGEILRLALPKSWVSCVPGVRGKPAGLLQQRWGRSLVGGAMFVVLKDAVMLYVRWRMARDHRRRRVVDYKGKRGSRVGLSSIS